MITKLDNGRIVLINGDALEWLPKVRQLATLIIADPPYFEVTKETWDHQWLDAADYIQWCSQWFVMCNDLLEQKGSFYLWQGIGHKSSVLIDLFVQLRRYMTFQDWITWQKSRGMGNRKGWLYTREECLWFSKSAEYLWNEAAQYDETQPTNRKDMGFNGKPRRSQFKRYTNVWPCNEDQNYGESRIRGHYTPKPLVLIDRIVNAHTTLPAHLVIDPFMGTGTTGVTCVQRHRRFIGIEKDTETFNDAVDRITKART